MTTLNIASFCDGSHITRADGARVRDVVEKHWGDAEPLTLDFAGIRVASVSFFDEMFGTIARQRSLEEIRERVKVVNIDEGDRRLLNGIIISRAKERVPRDADVSSDLVDYLRAAGVPDANLERWDRKLLALYQDHSGHSASFVEASNQAHEKAMRGAWIVDLGNFAMELSRERGAALKAALESLGVSYATRSLRADWAKSQRRQVSER